jgi:cytochrome c oxidase subunit 3
MNKEIKKTVSGDNKKQVEKAKMSLIYVGILSVVMFFGGLTSAYIVSMGDAFWIKFPLPNAFWISTALILLSSAVFQFSISFARQGKLKAMKISIVITLLLGLGFVYSQYKGYGQLAAKGSHLTGSGIVVSDGKYGSYFSIKQNGEFIVVDGNDYIRLGEKLTEEEMQSLKTFTKQFLKPKDKEQFQVKDDGVHRLYWEDQEMVILDGELQTNEGVKMEAVDRIRLSYMAAHIQDDRGHFFMRGQIGEDFHIYYKGVEMGYKNGNLTYNGVKLDTYLQVKALESADTASSYLWGITIAHLLHIIVTLLYLIRLVIRSFSGAINQDQNVSLRMGIVFWHFLGFLWLLLLLFLLFIH